jgi:hypothetical protein
MKTLNKLLFFNLQSVQPLCESISRRSLWQYVLSLRSRLSLGSRSAQSLRSLKTHATLGCRVGVNNIKTAYSEVLTNNRLFVGFVLMMGVAPLLYEAHHLFDSEVVIAGWYYKNWFYWFFTQREEFLFAFVLTGFFLMCPTKWGYRYLVVPFVGACITEIIYQSFYIDNYKDFYITPTWQFVVIATLALFTAFKVINYSVYRYNHPRRRMSSTLIGYIMMPGKDWAEKEETIKKLAQDCLDYNSIV